MEKKECISREIRSLNHAVRRYLNINCTETREAVDKKVGSSGWMIGYISEHNDSGTDVFQRDLEEAFGITRSGVSQRVDQLVEQGFLERKPVENDARLKKLVLTKEAQDIAQLMRKDAERLEEQLTAGFTDEELHLLHSMFERMKQNIGGKEKI